MDLGSSASSGQFVLGEPVNRCNKRSRTSLRIVGDPLSAMLERLPPVAGDLPRAPDDFAVPESLFARMECSQMVVSEDAIAFIAIPKHASYYIRTAEFPLHLIDAVASA